MSDTPRTDAVAVDGWSGDAICVSDDFARELERELAQKAATIDFLSRLSDAEGAAKERANDLLAKAETENAQLRALLGASLEDTARLDWLECPLGRDWQQKMPDATVLRSTIDTARKQEP